MKKEEPTHVVLRVAMSLDYGKRLHELRIYSGMSLLEVIAESLRLFEEKHGPGYTKAERPRLRLVDSDEDE